jgi:hypothetical protein
MAEVGENDNCLIFGANSVRNGFARADVGRSPARKMRRVSSRRRPRDLPISREFLVIAKFLREKSRNDAEK